MRKVAILISGKAGVGKTTLANFIKNSLIESGNIVCINPFAFEVKQTARYVGWDGIKDSRGRKLLQDIGQLVRDYNKDTWVRKTIERFGDQNAELFLTGYPEIQFMICDDWRFPNESWYIKNNTDMDTILIRVEAPDREILKGTPQYDEISENALPDGFEVLTDYDYVVSNSIEFTLDDLRNVANIIVDLIKKERSL